MGELSLEGCLDMYGAHIRLCVKDYAENHKYVKDMRKYISKQRTIRRGSLNSKAQRFVLRLHSYESARNYLFDGHLDRAILDFGLSLDAGCVRKFANDCARKGYVEEREGRISIKQIIDKGDGNDYINNADETDSRTFTRRQADNAIRSIAKLR